MKSLDIVHTLFLIIIFAVMGWWYFEFTQRQQWMDKKIEDVKNEAKEAGAAIRRMDGQWKTMAAQSEEQATNIKSIGDKINSGETQRQDLAAKIADLARDVENLKNDARQAASVITVTAAPAAEETASTQELKPVTEEPPEAGSSEEGAFLEEPAAAELGEIPLQ